MSRPHWSPSTGAPIRVALVGLGWASRTIWLPRLVGHPAYRVAAGVDPDPTAQAAVRGIVPGVPLVADVEDLAVDELDLAVVAVPNHRHAPVAARLLARGIPTFVEKPVCLTSAEADQLALAERYSEAVLLAGSAARYRADMRALYEVANRVGRLRHLELAWVRARGVPGAGGWFTSRALAGGGALVDLGWHLLDAVAPLLGPALFTRVVGTVSADHLDDDSARAAWRDGNGPTEGEPDRKSVV